MPRWHERLAAAVPNEVAGATTSVSCAEPSNAAVADMLEELLRRTHLGGPSELPAVVAEPARRIGARNVVLYLIDYEQRMLVPVAGPQDQDAAPLSVAGTVAGRAFSTTVGLPPQSAAWLRAAGDLCRDGRRGRRSVS
jgi:hypothetical protein